MDTDSEDENHKERTENITLSNNNTRTIKQREDRKPVHEHFIAETDSEDAGASTTDMSDKSPPIGEQDKVITKLKYWADCMRHLASLATFSFFGKHELVAKINTRIHFLFYVFTLGVCFPNNRNLSGGPRDIFPI